jgi:hypothetical protein
VVIGYCHLFPVPFKDEEAQAVGSSHLIVQEEKKFPLALFRLSNLNINLLPYQSAIMLPYCFLVLSISDSVLRFPYFLHSFALSFQIMLACLWIKSAEIVGTKENRRNTPKWNIIQNEQNKLIRRMENQSLSRIVGKLKWHLHTVINYLSPSRE